MPASDDRDAHRRYRHAGLAYGVLGALIMAITVATPDLANPERRGDLVYLLVGLPIFVLFALAIAYADRWFAGLAMALRATPDRAERIGAWCHEKLVMVLALSAFVRTLVLAGTGAGQRPRVLRDPLRLAIESVDPTPRMWINAVLMAVVCALLVRASWMPFLRRLRRVD